jgi:hypothetical protein
MGLQSCPKGEKGRVCFILFFPRKDSEKTNFILRGVKRGI